MARIIDFPTFGAYSRLPVTATDAQIIAFPRPMRADLPPAARAQMEKERRERQALELANWLFPASNLGK